jgi:membrane protein required for colicin V production
MEWYDLVMIAVLACATIFGFMKGMAWQIASLASLVASYFLALRFSAPLAATGILGNEEPWNRFLAMLVIYLATSLLIWVAFRFVSKAIDRVRLQEFDRQIGGLIGLAKGVLLCVAITFFAVTLATQTREAVLRSRSGHYIALLIARADGVMPPEVHEVLDPYLNRLEEELNGQGGPTEHPATRASITPPPAPGKSSVGAGPLLGNPAAAAEKLNAAARAIGDSVTRELHSAGTRLEQPWSRADDR